MGKRLYVHADNLLVEGRLYRRGDIGYFRESATTDALLSAGALSLIPYAPKVDKPSRIVENKESISTSEDKSDGNKRKSKSRRVRSSSETVSEGLPGAESSD